MKFCLKWVHMARYGVILRLDGALWHTIVSGPLLTQKRAIKIKQIPKISKTCSGNTSWGSKTPQGTKSLQGPCAARDLATYLIPGCVGRGVRLGFEGSSVGGGGGGGVWKSRCFGQNKNFRFLTHSRDLGAILPPNWSYGRCASFLFSRNHEKLA